MQSGWRLYAVMIALAALTGTVVALALSGGPRLPAESPRRASPTAGATASELPVAAASPSPSPTATETPTPSPTPTATPGDPLQRIHPLVFAWRPTATSAIVSIERGETVQIVAVGLDDAKATPLLELPKGTEWHMRRDGSAVAFTVPVGDVLPRTRIAALNLQTGALGWVTPDEPSASQRSPLWSLDGSVVYYTRTSYDGAIDLGIYRIRVDGTNLTQLRAPSSDGAIAVTGITPDGLGLVLRRGVVSGIVDVLDLNTRAIRSFLTPPLSGGGARPSGRAEAWRPERPRALVAFGGPAGGLQLYLWDDLAAPVSPGPSASPAPTPSPLAQGSFIDGADWDPTGSRIVAALSTVGGGSRLVTMDARGEARTTIEGTDGASTPYWLDTRIVYLYGPSTIPTEVRVVGADGGASSTLYTGGPITRLTYVRP